MPNSLSSKGQMFMVIVVAVAITLILARAFMNKEAYIKTYEFAFNDEPYFFNNVIEKFIQTIDESECIELEDNLKLYTNFVRKVASKMGYSLQISYRVVYLSGTCGVLDASFRLASSKAVLTSTFSYRKE